MARISTTLVQLALLAVLLFAPGCGRGDSLGIPKLDPTQKYFLELERIEEHLDEYERRMAEATTPAEQNEALRYGIGVYQTIMNEVGSLDTTDVDPMMCEYGAMLTESFRTLIERMKRILEIREILPTETNRTTAARLIAEANQIQEDLQKEAQTITAFEKKLSAMLSERYGSDP